jgi:hypothetical protein
MAASSGPDLGCYRFRLGEDHSLILVYTIKYQTYSSVWVLVGKLVSQVRHLPSYIPH